jgi:hypothetical protein
MAELLMQASSLIRVSKNISELHNIQISWNARALSLIVGTQQKILIKGLRMA